MLSERGPHEGFAVPFRIALSIGPNVASTCRSLISRIGIIQISACLICLGTFSRSTVVFGFAFPRSARCIHRTPVAAVRVDNRPACRRVELNDLVYRTDLEISIVQLIHRCTFRQTRFEAEGANSATVREALPAPPTPNSRRFESRRADPCQTRSRGEIKQRHLRTVCAGYPRGESGQSTDAG